MLISIIRIQTVATEIYELENHHHRRRRRRQNCTRFHYRRLQHNSIRLVCPRNWILGLAVMVLLEGELDWLGKEVERY
jgi:hypothetical protein